MASGRHAPGVLRSSPEFRSLWAANALSVTGDQLARVALAVLVYNRTSSAALTALTYALTFAPSLIGGIGLAGLADRYPRRAVLIVTDLIRAGLAAAMALPGLPLPVLWALVAVLATGAGPFKAAQGATLPAVLPEPAAFQAGVALWQASGQVAQLGGFAVGGFAVVALGPEWCLVLDAATFLASAMFVRIGVRARPAPDPAATTPDPASVDPVARTGGRGGLAVVFALTGLTGLYVVGEGVAAPYAHSIGAAAVGVGWLMAADPLGSVAGAWLTTRLRLPATPAVMIGAAALAGVPLVATGFRPGLVATMVLWAASGALSEIMWIHVTVSVKDLVPDHRRGRVTGRLSAVLYTGQGLAILAAGAVAGVVGPAVAVAAAGVGAISAAALIGGGWWLGRARSRRQTGTEQNEPVSTDHGRAQRSLLRNMSRTSFPRPAGRAPGPATVGGQAPNTGPAGDTEASSMGGRLGTGQRPTGSR